MKCKQLFVALILALLVLATAGAADYGVQILNSTGLGYQTSDTVPSFSQFNRATAWLSFLFGSDLDLYISGQYDFSLSVDPDGTSVVRPYRFDFGRTVFSGVLPGAVGPSSILSFSLGRFPFQDFSGRVVAGLNDGFLVNLALGSHQLKLGAAYLGLQEKQTALVLVDIDDRRRLSGADKADPAAPNFPDSYFSLPRLFFNFGYRGNELLTGYDFGVDILGQFDLLPDTVRTHTYYLEPYISGRLGRLFRWNAWYVLGLIQASELKTSMAAGARLRFTVPELSGFNSLLAIHWASGTTGTSLVNFVPIRQSVVSSQAGLYFENVLNASLSLGFSPFTGFTANALGGLFMRGGDQSPSARNINPDSAARLIGVNTNFNVQYSLTSDVMVSMSGSGFFPNKDAYLPDSPMVFRGSLVLILDL
jgi:hypothetical protein